MTDFEIYTHNARASLLNFELAWARFQCEFPDARY